MEPIPGPFAITRLEWTTHILTHIDAPRHFFPRGLAIDAISPQRFIGDALVIQVDGDAVLPRHLPSDLRGLNLLFKTRNRWEIRPDHVYVSAEAAQALADGGANLVGIDYLTVDRFDDEAYPAHRILLGAGVLILEGIDLESVPPGRYELIALPLRVANGDGSPVRAVLMEL